MPVGLVAHILGWNKEGVAVLELFDTVALKLLFCRQFHNNAQQVSNNKADGINLGHQLVEEGLAQLLPNGRNPKKSEKVTLCTTDVLKSLRSI